MNNIINVIKNNTKFYIMLAIVILLGTIGITFSLVISQFNAIAINTDMLEIDADISYDINSNGEEVISTGNMLPISDELVIGPNVTDSRVLKVTFNVTGNSNNPENTIYDIALHNINVDCDLRTKDLKWRLYKGYELISREDASLSPTFDTMNNNRLVLTETQQDLTTDTDKYTFLLWISESCTGDITECDSSMDQSKYLGKEFSASIKVELSTKSKKEVSRITGSENSCTYEEVDIPVCNTVTYNGSSQTLISTDSTNYTLTNTTGINAGTYKITAKLNDECKWSNGETEDKVLTCNIDKKDVTVTTLNQTITYGNKISNSVDNISTSDLLSNDTVDTVTLSSDTVDVGTGKISVNNVKIINSNNTDITSNYNIIKKNTGVVTINCSNIAVEPNIGNVMYTGEELTGVTGGSYITITGSKVGTEVGSYKVVAKPNKNYCWSDGTTAEKEYTWNIQHGEYQVILDNKEANTIGTEKLYGRNQDGIYLDNNYKNKMSSTSNPITLPTKEGYTFDGYYTEENGSGTLVINTNGFLVSDLPTSISVLYAKWNANTYTISYNANGGSGTTESSSHTYGIDKELTANGFTRIGYTFLGWSNTEDATSATYTDKQSVKNLTSINGETITLYAVWKINKVYITYNVNGGIIAEQTTNSSGTSYNWSTDSSGLIYLNSSIYLNSVSYGSSTSAGYIANYNSPTAINISRTGYSAVNTQEWICLSGCTTENKTFNQLSVAYVSSDFCDASTTDCTVVLGVNWSPNVYTVSYDANGGSGAPSAQSKTHDISLTLSNTKPTRTGYTFVGWNTASDGSGTSYLAGSVYEENSSTTLYAQWNINKVTITYNTNGGTVTASNSGGEWSTDLDGTVYRNSALLTHSINYGGTLGSSGLANYNNTSSLNITHSNSTIKAISGEEWICISGCSTIGKTYNHKTVYSASDFCDLSSSSCDVELGVNWDNAISGGSVSISGTLEYGYKLTANVTAPVVPSSGITYSYEWFANSTASTEGGTSLGTSSTYRAWAASFNKYVYVVVTMTDSSGVYASKTVKAITSAPIGKRNITVVSGSSSKTYNGTALTNSECGLDSDSTVAPGGGQYLECATSGTRTAAGTSNNTISTAKVLKDDGSDVSKYYNITLSPGTLTINKASCTCSISSYPTSLNYPKSKTGTIKYSCGGDGTIYVSSSDTAVITAGTAGDTSTTLTAKSVGSSTVTVGRKAGTNYKACSKTQAVAVTASTYTVCFDANGGSGAPACLTKTYGVTLKLPTTVPTRSGYVFKGWNKDKPATSATHDSGGNYTTNADATFYAVWESGVKLIDYIRTLYTSKTRSAGTNSNVSTYYVSYQDSGKTWGLMNDGYNGTTKVTNTTYLSNGTRGNIRYFGANPNNYIYFNCTTYPSTTCELWRIVGIVDGKVKIVRQDSLGAMAWHQPNNEGSDTLFFNNWPNASLKVFLNGKYYNRGSTTTFKYYSGDSGGTSISLNLANVGIKASTRSLISPSTWYLGSFSTTSGLYADDVYTKERTNSSSTVVSGNTFSITDTNVGLPYTSDYAYSSDLNKCSYSLYDYNLGSCASTSYFHKSGVGQWFINPASNDTYQAWKTLTGGDMGTYYTYGTTEHARPTVYLDDAIIIESGNTGTSSSPYRIKTS